MSSKLNSNTRGMDLWRAREVIDNYEDNGKIITDEVREAYKLFSGFGMKSYPLMRCLLINEKRTKAFLELEGRIGSDLKNKKTLR